MSDETRTHNPDDPTYPVDASTVMLSEQEVEKLSSLRRPRELEPQHQRLFNRYRDLILNDELDIRFDYEIGDVLGRGRQGVVFHLERRSHIACLTTHALKVFDPSIYFSEAEYRSDMERIARQVGSLQRLFHPNLVQCDWMHEEDGIGMLMMQRIEGMDLRALMDPKQHRETHPELAAQDRTHVDEVMFPTPGRGLHPGIAVYVLRKILRGLELMHQIGYMHCDIKPSNIMVDRFATLKIIDFGRAISIKNPTGIFLGSPMYMAPELHKREPLTPLADLYSAGLVLLELLHGDWIASPGSNEEELLEIKRTLPDRLADFIPTGFGYEDVLIPILKRLLAVNPDDRYPSAREADIGLDGVRSIHQHLARESIDFDYGRELEKYMQSRLQVARPDLAIGPDTASTT